MNYLGIRLLAFAFDVGEKLILEQTEAAAYIARKAAAFFHAILEERKRDQH